MSDHAKLLQHHNQAFSTIAADIVLPVFELGGDIRHALVLTRDVVARVFAGVVPAELDDDMLATLLDGVRKRLPEIREALAPIGEDGIAWPLTQ